jgi:quercetin dioxygenase-like cupin family protein
MADDAVLEAVGPRLRALRKHRGTTQRTHEGYEWLYVLAGTVRLALGDQGFVLTEGEAAEFDTRVPHAFANAGRRPAELLHLFGPQGERVHLRARTTRKDNT